MSLTKKDYELAIVVQDACNLSGIVHSLSELLPRIRDDPDCTGTDFVNTHPIVVLYVNKLSSLSGAENGMAFSTAYDECKKKAKRLCDCGADRSGGIHVPDCPVTLT